MPFESDPDIPNTSPNNRFFLVTSITYILLLSYGTLYPLSDWELAGISPFSLFNLEWPQHTSWPDLVTNLIVYMPLGVLLTLALQFRGSPLKSLVIITCTGLLLSFSLEYLQLFLPARTTSLVDIVLNGSGTFIGASIATITQSNTLVRKHFSTIQQKYYDSSPLTNIGLAAIAFWALSQLMPVVPSLDFGNLRDGIRPVWNTLNSLSSFDIWKFCEYSLNIAALGLIHQNLTKSYSTSTKGFAFFVIFVLLLKVPIVTRQLSLEAVSGLMAGLLTWEALLFIKKGTALKISASFIIFAFLIGGLHGQGGLNLSVRTMEWIPFKGQMANLLGLVDVTTSIWPFIALAYISISLRPDKLFQIIFLGSIAVFMATFSIEWLQQSIPGRYPDITDVVLATFTFFLTCMYQIQKTKHSLVTRPKVARPK